MTFFYWFDISDVDTDRHDVFGYPLMELPMNTINEMRNALKYLGNLGNLKTKEWKKKQCVA